MRPDTVIAIVGPTGVGKSALAEEVALTLRGGIVSADSMQVYRGMDVGTAKVPLSERRVGYHCIDIADPGADYSAALFQHDARTAIRDILHAGHTPVLVGGTGLYVRAALDDMRFASGDLTSATRADYEAIAAEEGAAALHALLSTRDPGSAALIHPNNVRRVVRALEMADEGVSYAQQAAGFKDRVSVFPTVFIGMTMDRRCLYERIDARVDAMFGEGLLDEVRALLSAGYRDAVTAAQAIGYKELVPVIEDGAPLAEAVSAIKQATRRYAKRQLTWFRADPRIHWIDVTDMSPTQATTHALQLIESSEPTAPMATQE